MEWRRCVYLSWIEKEEEKNERKGIDNLSMYQSSGCWTLRVSPRRNCWNGFREKFHDSLHKSGSERIKLDLDLETNGHNMANSKWILTKWRRPRLKKGNIATQQTSRPRQLMRTFMSVGTTETLEPKQEKEREKKLSRGLKKKRKRWKDDRTLNQVEEDWFNFLLGSARRTKPSSILAWPICGG